MTDREKIVKIIEKNGVYNGRSLSFDYYVIQPDDLADALIEAGIRDINQKGLVAVNGEVSIVTKNIIADAKDALDGNLAEWKRRAEVAEHKLLELAMFCTKGNPYLSKEHSQEKEAYKLFNDWLQQAAREIEEERK